MKAVSAIATLPLLRSRANRPAKEIERKERVRHQAERSIQQAEWWAAWEADPTITAMAMLRMLGR
jgi:hypothetical protein